MRTRILLLFLASLAFAQEPAIHKDIYITCASADGKEMTAQECKDLSESNIGKEATQIAGLHTEIRRLTTLLNWYQQQFFALQARQIEQQIAPVKPAPKPKPNGETK